MHQRTLKAILFAGFIAAQMNIISVQAITLTTNADWAWMKGASFTDQTGTYGTQGTAAPANTPGARDSAVSWVDGAGALWLFGGNGYDASSGTSELNDLWKFDPVTTNWTWMKGSTVSIEAGIYGTQGTPATTNTPGARYGAISWVDGAGVLWLFGGYGRDNATNQGDLNDLWKFNPVTTNWTWMKGTNINYQAGTYGTRGTPAPANTPGAREYAVSWVDGAGALWLFGGYGGDTLGNYGNLNDLWKYDPVTTNWTWIKGSDITNQAGTYGTRGTPAPANMPGARERTVSWVDGAGALWLFGGNGLDASRNTGALNDLWKFDPVTTNWTWIKGSDITNQVGTYGTRGTPAPANTPGARQGAGAWTDPTGALWLFGGYGRDVSGNTESLNDLWKFDPATTNWTWMKGTNVVGQYATYGTRGVPAPANKPGAREYALSWVDGAGALWLFGGNGYVTSGGKGHLNDLWKFEVLGGISLDTQTLVFGATYQGANPAAQMIGMINVGGTAFTYTNVITYSAGASGWLTVLPAAGTIATNGALVLTNQVDITGLGAGTYYATNQVTADATNSPQTVVITLSVYAVPPPNPPAAPAGVSATDGAYLDKVLVTWNAVSDATSYEVWHSTSNNSGAALKLSSPDPTGTSYDDTSAAAGATYYYWVKAVNSAGASGFSVSDSGYRAVALTPPSAPAGVSASDGAYLDKVLITWNAASGAASYEVWRSTSNNSGAALKLSSPDPSYNDTSAAAGTTYYYWVKAVNSAGASPFSTSDSGFIGVVGPLITANGLVGDVYLDRGDPVTIAVQMMNIDPYLGVEVDWWVVAFAHSGEWYYLDNTMQWRLFSGELAFCQPVYRGALCNLSSTPVLPDYILPVGTYNFWFAIDYPMDSILNLSGPILFDCVTVVAQ